MLLYKEVAESESCEDCPLKKEDICPGGWSCYGGEPIEPPCCSFNDDTDLDQWVENYYVGLQKYEDTEDRRIQAERKRNERNVIAAQRRREAKQAIWNETQEIKSLHRHISANEAALRFASDLSFSINTTNEMFGYKERFKPAGKSAIEKENAIYRERIIELEAIKKEKLKLLRKRRKADQ